MSKYADIEQIKEVIRTEWVKYMPLDLDVNLSFVLGEIAEVPTIEVSEDCISRTWLWKNYQTVCENVICSECPFDKDKTAILLPEDVVADELRERPLLFRLMSEDCRLADFMMNAPSVVPSRAEGEWINKQEKYQMAECSNCKKVTMHEMWGDKLVYYDYCPNCGAKMKG